MDTAEIFGRVREKLRHTTERFALPALRDFSIGAASASVPLLPAKEDAPKALKEALAADALKLLSGKWTLFGWNEVSVSIPPDWHRDCVRGVNVPADAGKLNHRAPPGGADGRNIWEINRWAEPVRLAMHGWLNDDSGAVRQAQAWLADWVEMNPPGHGVNWSSALEGGLRLINFCWFDALVTKHGAWSTEHGDDEFQRRHRELVDAIVPAHAWWVRRYLSFGSSANNHRLGELTGLLLAVRRWPELERIAGTADELWEQISDCVLSQFAEDGGNWEQALHYHLFAFEMALHACRAMNVTDGPVIGRLQKAAEFFVRMSHPQEPWDYGDSDDAQIVPLTMRREETVAEWCAWMWTSSAGILPATCASGILPDESCGVTAGSLSYWLGHASSVGQNARRTGNRQNACSTGWWIAPQSGMAVIERDGWKVRLDASPLGFGKMAAHGHCDALHVSIWNGEQALVIDPGTGGYCGSTDLRNELASWNAHNGPQPLGGFKTPRRMGTFLWTEHHAPLELLLDGGGVKALLQHEGFRLSRLVKVEDGAVVVEDSEGGGRPFCVRWIFTPHYEVSRAHGEPIAFLVRQRSGNLRWHIEMDKRATVTLASATASRGYEDEVSCVMIACLSNAASVTTIRRVPKR